jgi:DHA3 family macrolide efflux protein-like MFS transporter
MMIALIITFYLGLVGASPLYETRYGAAITLLLLSTALGFGISLGNMYINVEMFNVIDRSYLARVSGIGSAISVGITPVTAFVISIVVKLTSTKVILVMAGVVAFLFGMYMLTSGTKAIVEAERENKESSALADEKSCADKITA